MKKFFGEIDDLRIIVRKANILGTWKAEKSGNSMKHSFRSVKGGILNWWTNGTINFQGKEFGRLTLERALFGHLHDDRILHDNYSEDWEYDASMDDD